MRERPRVGEILVAAGIIDEMQLESALGEQQRWGRRLGVTLIKLGMVEEGHLIRALAKQLDLPVASLAGKRIPEDVIALVPGRMATEHGVLPLFTKDVGPTGQLFLGMEDPSNLAVLDDLSFRTGMEVRPVMVGPTELGEAIDRYYHRPDDGASALPDPLGDTMTPASLRVVTDDSPQPGTAPADPSIGTEVAGRSPRPAPPAPPAPEVVPPAPEVAPSAPRAAPAAPQAAPTPAAPTPVRTPAGPAPAPLPESLLADVARAAEESERTRLVAKAITQLLIEKGVLTLDELQARTAELKAATRADAASDD